MKTKIIAFLFLILLLSGCGITQGSIKTPDKDIHFIMGKEYGSFILYYKKGDEEFFIHAKKVDAFEGQELIKDGLVDAVKAAVKSAMPIP